MQRPTPLVPALPVLGWLETGRITPLRLGAGILVAMLVLRAAVIAGFVHLGPLFGGGLPPLALRDIRIGFVLALVLAYAPACYGWSVQGLRAQREGLRGLFGASSRALDETLAQAGHLTVRARRRAMAWGVAGAYVVPFVVDRDPQLYLDPAYWHAQNVLNWILLPFVGLLVSCVGRSLWTDAQRLTTLAGRIERLDLLDERSVAPFGHEALRLALLTVVLPSFGAVLLLDRGFAEVIAALAVVGAAFATTAFLLPVQGIHQRLVREKEEELARVRAALRGEAAALRRSGLQAFAERASPADLLAYEARIAAVREWPFDVSLLARFAALFLLPVVSWLGGALVERWVSRLLG